MGWGRALTYSTLGAWAEGLMNKQGCQGRLEEVSSILHALHPSRVGGLQRQSWNEMFPSRVFLICFPRPIPTSSPPNIDCTLFWTLWICLTLFSYPFQWYTRVHYYLGNSGLVLQD